MNFVRTATVGTILAASAAFGLTACSSTTGTTSTPVPTAPSGGSGSSLPTGLPTGVATGTTTLPTGWPSDLPAPTGLELTRVIQSPTTATGKIAIYYGTGDMAAVSAQMTAGMKAAGYTNSSATDHGSVAISTWKKGPTIVGLNINTAAGKVTCSVSVSPLG